MKKYAMALLATLLAGSLTGCQHHNTVIAAETPEKVTQTYQGIFPCADCEGIQVTLSLQQGGVYRLNEHYLGSDSVETAQHGRWMRTAEKLVLVSDSGEKRYFRPQASGLEMTDRQGNPAPSGIAYRLLPVKAGN